jgi:AraC family transcriptional regulator, ethanolamine operon transcriptional activator
MDNASTSPANADSSVFLHNIDELNHAVSGSDLELVQLKPGRLDAMLSQIALADLSIDQGRVNQSIRVCGRLDPQRFAIGLFPPHSRATWNGHHIDNSHLLLFKPGGELNGHLSGGYTWTSLVVPLQWIASIARGLPHSGAFEFRSDCKWARPDPTRLDDLRRATAAVVMPTSPVLLSPELAQWLLTELQNSLGAALISLDPSSDKTSYQALAHFSLARRAERYMRERISEPVCIDDLCVALHVSRRYLEYAFSDAFGTSPSRYLRLLRLTEVRHRLRVLGNRTTVTHEATRLGFCHLSQFSVQYKRLFGQSPSDTLAAASR